MKRRTIVFDDDVVKLVDDWRKTQDKIPSFNTAINAIIRAYRDTIDTAGVIKNNKCLLCQREVKVE